MLTALLVPSLGHAEGATAETDSLVWYIEQLEHDIAIQRIRYEAGNDSLQIRLDLTQRQLEWAREDERKWYHSPGLWFIIGAGAGVLVSGMAANAVFD